jgi:hypothetical protein
MKTSSISGRLAGASEPGTDQDRDWHDLHSPQGPTAKAAQMPVAAVRARFFRAGVELSR